MFLNFEMHRTLRSPRGGLVVFYVLFLRVYAWFSVTTKFTPLKHLEAIFCAGQRIYCCAPSRPPPCPFRPPLLKKRLLGNRTRPNPCTVNNEVYSRQGIHIVLISSCASFESLGRCRQGYRTENAHHSTRQGIRTSSESRSAL